jgi:hypothetical protein
MEKLLFSPIKLLEKKGKFCSSFSSSFSCFTQPQLIDSISINGLRAKPAREKLNAVFEKDD